MEYHGCDHLLAPAEHPTCVLGEGRRLALWVEAPPERSPRVAAGGVTLTAGEARQAAGGFLFELEIPEGVRAVTVEVAGAAAEPSSAGSRWRLALADDPHRGAKAELRKEVGERVAAGDRSGARELLQRRLAAASEPRLRGFVLSTLGRLEHLAGDPRSARRNFGRALAEHRRAGDLSTEIKDATLLFRLLFYDLEEVAAAVEVLDALPEPPAGDAETAYLEAYHRGSLARRTGDARGAHRHLEEAADRARRFRLTRLRNQAEQLLALQLRALGLHGRAGRLFERLAEEADELGACEAGQLVGNAAWDRLLAREAGCSRADPLPLLERARRLLEGCAAGERANLEINLALARIQRGEPAAARRHLDAALRLDAAPGARLLVWWQEIEARIARAEGRVGDAERHYRELGRLGAAISSPEAVWRATVGRAELLRSGGRVEEALAAFAEAEELLDRTSLRLPLDAEAASALPAGTREHLDLLLTEGRREAAFALARRSRSRRARALRVESRLAELGSDERRRWAELVLRFETGRRALDEAVTATWRVPGDRLELARAQQAERRRELGRLLEEAVALLGEAGGAAPPAGPPLPGEVVLLYHPLPRGWVGFAADAAGVAARRLPVAEPLPEDGPELSRFLLEPFDAAIGRSRRVRVLSWGALDGVDLHALPWRGEPLLVVRPVTYGIDLPRVEPQPDGRRRALLVADPTGSLPAALQVEIPTVRRVLERSPRAWRTELLHGPGATAEAIRGGLGGVELLHFAGHADVLGAGESHLRAAGGSRLGAGEILTRRAVPATVVLSACESARAAGSGPAGEAAGGLGLAEAFLLAGSRRVIGAVRPVDDAATARLVEVFYRAWDGGDGAAEALRRAQLELRTADPAADWSSFRLIER